ncbi:MAG: undecaprenyl-diphosphate phosphatase [Meiothermus sp.]|nr:undecaprenyl-diphosphate phosphatase [Meiothermus sp.]
MGGVTVLDAFILGVVEGLTEFLPVSSTGHQVLVGHLLGLDVENDPFIKSFIVIIQLGAILAVMTLYLQRFLRDFEVWKRVIVAFIPTGILGLLLTDFLEGLLGSDLVVVINLIGVGVLLLFIDRLMAGRQKYDDINQVPLFQSGAIGLFQSIAMVPGVSRSAATIIGGMFLGLSRRAAAEFSFILAVPTMLVASGYSIVRRPEQFEGANWGLIAVGFVTAFVVALVSVRWMLDFVSKNTFVPFGIYRIVVGVVYAAFFLR